MFRRILKRLITGEKTDNGQKPDDRGLNDAVAAQQEVFRQSAEVQEEGPSFDTKLADMKKRISETKFKRKEATG